MSFAVVILVIVFFVLSRVAGGVAYWKRDELFNNNTTSGTVSGTSDLAALGESCVNNECESPLRCDPSSMTCAEPIPIDCVGAWGEWSTCELIDPSDECATKGIRTKTYSVTKEAKFGGKLCEKRHGQLLTKPCRVRELNQLPRKCHPDAIYDCQGHYQDRDEYCQGIYTRDPDACGTGMMGQLPFVITKEEVSNVTGRDGKLRRNVGRCPLRNTFQDTTCGSYKYC